MFFFFFLGQMRVFISLCVFDYSLECMQFPVSHVLGYNMEKSHEDSPKMFRTKDLIEQR